MAAGTTAALVHLGEGLATARRPRAAALALEAAAAGDGEPLVRAAARTRAAELLLIALDAEAAAAAAAAAAASAAAASATATAVSEGRSGGGAAVQATGSAGWPAKARPSVPQTLSRVRHNTEQALLLLRGVAGALGPTLAALSLTDEVYTRSGDARGVLRILGRAHAALRDAGPVAPAASSSLTSSPGRGGGGAGAVGGGVDGDGTGEVDRWGWWLFLRGRAVSVQSRSAPGAAAVAAADAAAECRRRGDERAAAGFTLALVQLRLAAPATVDAAALATDFATVEAAVGLPARGSAAPAPPLGTAGTADRPPLSKRPRLPMPPASVDPDAALMRAALLCLRAVADLRRGDFPAVVAAAGALSAAFNACSPSQRSSAVAAGATAGVGQPPPRPRWVWFHRRALRALLLHCSATALAAADPRGAIGRAADALAALGVTKPAILTDDPSRLRTALAATSLSNLDADCRHALAAAAAEGAARAELTRCCLAAAAPYVRAVASLASSISDTRAAVACGAAARLLTSQYRVLLGDKAEASAALTELEGVALKPPAAGVPRGTRHMAAVYCSTLTGRAITEFLPDGGVEALACVSTPRAAENGQVDAALLFAQALVSAQQDQVRDATGLMDMALRRAGVERRVPDAGTAGGGGAGASGGGGGVNRALVAAILSVRIGLVAVSGESADAALAAGAGGAEEGRRAAEQWAADAGDLTTLIRVAKAAKRSSRRHLDVDGARAAKDSVASLSAKLSERQRLAPRW